MNTASLERSACKLCDHGKTGQCVCPEVRGQKPAEDFEAARRTWGPCGPEARYLDFPGLKP